VAGGGEGDLGAGAMTPNGKTAPRNLVVVRAGDSSLHPTWLGGPEQPAFDLIVSYFGDDPDRFRSPIEARVDQKGGKWDGLAALFVARPELLDRYDFIWLPDDDIAADTRTVNGIFDAMSRCDLALAQPGLTSDSYYTYIGYLRSRSFTLRYSNAIEIMAPCVRSDLLRRAIPLVMNSPSGWGLDAVWTRLDDDNRRKSAILDQWPVRHTRPLGKALAAAIAKQGGSPWDDLSEMRRRFGMTRLYPLIYEAVDARGRRWTNKIAIGARMGVDFLMERARIAHYDASRNNIFQLVRRQLSHTPDLSRLAPREGGDRRTRGAES
jgi:hypothetical protein